MPTFVRPVPATLPRELRGPARARYSAFIRSFSFLSVSPYFFFDWKIPTRGFWLCSLPALSPGPTLTITRRCPTHFEHSLGCIEASFFVSSHLSFTFSSRSFPKNPL